MPTNSNSNSRIEVLLRRDQEKANEKIRRDQEKEKAELKQRKDELRRKNALNDTRASSKRRLPTKMTHKTQNPEFQDTFRCF
tara:strand:- start:13128 stop:13373 length:246 start_codon:yes stop_codon:yes gene_type:complete